MARASTFNKSTVKEFFDLLERLIKENNIGGSNICNLDESWFTTVQKVPKVVACKGVKKAGQITSRERGELLTACATVSATSVALPPVFACPRKNYRYFFLTGAPEGSLVLCSDSGWMNSDLFLKVIEHVVMHTKVSKEASIILTLDKHESHVSLDTL